MEALEVALPSSLPSLQLLECLHLLPDMLPAQNLHGCGGRALSPGPPASAWPAQAAGYHWWKPCSLTAPFLLASVLAPPPREGHGVGPRFPEGLRSRASKGSRPCPGPGVSFSQDAGSKASSRSGSGQRPGLGSGARWGPQGLRPRRAARAALHSLQPLPQPRFLAPGPLERRLGDAERRAGTPTRREAHGLLLDPPGLCCCLAAVPP